MTLPRLLPLAAVLLLASRPAGALTITDCLSSRYLVDGKALVVGDTTPNEPVAIQNGVVSIGTACPPAPVRYRFLPSETVIRAVFPRCTGVRGPARLTVTLPTDCSNVTGRLRARRLNRKFTARRSTCGDGIVDASAGEECDRSRCSAGDECSASCRCVPIPIPTTTTSTSTSTSVTTTSTVTTVPTTTTTSTTEPPGPSVARQWDEVALDAVRRDIPRPTVHARNLFHVSVAMWDAWAVYDRSGVARQYISAEPAQVSATSDADRAQAISFAAYRVLKQRYSSAYAASPGSATSEAEFDALMDTLGYDKTDTSTVGSSPSAVGNRIGAALLAYGAADGANEPGYGDVTYFPVNDPLVVALPTSVPMTDPNRWQPLALAFQVTQNGIPIPDQVQTFIGAHWDSVRPWAMVRTTSGHPYHDPGPPPQISTPTLTSPTDAAYKSNFFENVGKSSLLDPTDGVTIDVSPAVRGNNTLGTNDGTGYAVNPATGQPYGPNVVKRADWARVLAEFWADGPNSETPPGHWNVIANYVTDHLDGERRLGGTGPVLSKLEWDVKLYLAVNGAVHDAAIACWGTKRFYDGVRPISAIRNMAHYGQSSDPAQPSYDTRGLPLEPDLSEVITAATTAPGQRHEKFRGLEGNIAVRSWPGQPTNPLTQASGVQWVLAVRWMPYQKSTFVTPAFAGYPSGHSTFSRSAAEVLTSFTGSPYFPGGLGEFTAPANDFLKFELGPTQTVVLQWATYYDAADEAGLSRLYGGIHPPIDDFTGRIMGSAIGKDAFAKALQFYGTPAN